MTDDLVARLRHEQELCAVMGDTKAGALVGEAADRLEALEIKERESFQQYVDANEARIDAEARVRELEAENKRLAERLDLLAVGFGVPDGGRYIADWQTKIDKLKAAERELAEAYERAAKVADEHRAHVPNHDPEMQSDDLVAQGYGNAAFNIAAAIRKMSQEVKHEAE